MEGVGDVPGEADQEVQMPLELSCLWSLPALLMGQDLRVRGFSPAAERFGFGKTNVGAHVSELRHQLTGSADDEELNLESLVDRVTKTGVSISRHVRDAGGRWHSMRIQPCGDPGADAYGALLLLIDIDDAKRREQKSAFMAAIVMSSDDAIISKDLDGVILSWNRAAERLYGYTAEEAIGKPVAMLIPPGHDDEEPEILARIRSGQSIDHYETVRMHKDGTLIDVSLTVSPVKDFDGRIMGAAKIARDITERKLADQALRDSEGKFRMVADHAPVLIWVNNSDSDCEFVNKTYLDFLGVGMEEVINIGWAKYVHPEDSENYLNAFIEASKLLRRFESEFRFRRADGEYRWMKSVGVPLITGGGEFVGYIGSTIDISDRKQDESRLLQAQKLESMGVLAGGIAHDFNNLLTGILGASSLVLEMDDIPSEARPLLQGVTKACMRAADLTRQILAYAGKGRFVIEPIDASDLTAEITELLRASVPKNVEIHLDLDAGLPAVMGDRGQMQQVIMNLILNATEAFDEGTSGSVWVSTSVETLTDNTERNEFAPVLAEPGTYLVLRVVDNGSGMAEGSLARIFDPFYSTKSQGRGLGLSAVLGIVRGHKGGLSVKSQTGEGTTFEVLFPVQEDVHAQLADSRTNAKASNTPHATGTVLVIDDEEIIRKVVHTSLTREGMSVLTAENGLEGAILFENNLEDIVCVLLDLTMPVMSGAEALKRIKAIRPDIPVVVMSGYSEMEASRQFASDEQLVFLQKPFATEDLHDKLRTIGLL